MSIMRLLWSFLTRSEDWLELLDKESRDEEEPMYGEEPKKHRTMWG